MEILNKSAAFTEKLLRKQKGWIFLHALLIKDWDIEIEQYKEGRSAQNGGKAYKSLKNFTKVGQRKKVPKCAKFEFVITSFLFWGLFYGVLGGFWTLEYFLHLPFEEINS